VTAAAAVLLGVAALAGTLAWPGRVLLRLRTVLASATVLLLVTAFVLLAAGQQPGVGDVRSPTSVRQALGWLLVGWLAAAGGGPLTEVVLRLGSWGPFLEALREGRWWGREDEALDAEQDAAAQELRGGALIGVLERLAVTGAVLAGAAPGIALVVAVKALGRYPELRTAGASERFIIGTLASLLWAAAVAGTGVLLLR
jgi:hypothetical protein